MFNLEIPHFEFTTKTKWQYHHIMFNLNSANVEVNINPELLTILSYSCWKACYRSYNVNTHKRKGITVQDTFILHTFTNFPDPTAVTSATSNTVAKSYSQNKRVKRSQPEDKHTDSATYKQNTHTRLKCAHFSLYWEHLSWCLRFITEKWSGRKCEILE